MKLKAAVAMRSLLNKLNITDRRKESFTDETSAASMIQGSITSHVPSKLSSKQTLDPTVNWLLDDKKCKDNLSKTWSYFVNDLNEVRDLNEVSEASDCEKNIENQVCDILGPNKGHYELGYYPDESNDMNWNSTLVQRPLACRIKMGISVLQGGNTTKPSDSEITYLELKHRVLSQNEPASLPAISTDPGFGMPTFMGDHKDVLSQRSRRSSCPLAGSSSFLEASFSGMKPRIYDELPDHQSHFSFLPLIPAHTSKVSRPQCVDESYRSKNFMTASSSHMILQSPRNVPGASLYFQETIDESSSTGKGHASNFRGQQFLARRSSLQLLKATQCSNSTYSKAQLVSESTKSINLLKESRKLTCLPTPRLPTATLCPKFRVINDESAPTSQQVLGSQDEGDSLYDAVVPNSSNLSSIMFSKRHASFLAVENNSHPSVGDITVPISSFQAATTGSVCSHRNRWSLSDACRFPLESVVREPPQLTLQNHQLGITSTSSTIATLAVNSASHVPTAARTVRQVGSEDKPHVSLPKSARRCLHGNLKHQLPVGSLESNSMPKRAKILECGKNEPASVSPSSVYSKTAASVESQRSPNLGCNHPIATESSGSSYHSHKPPNYSLMNTVLKQTSRDSDKRPSNASLATTDVCSFHLPELPETDVNGNYIALFADRSVLSPQTKQHLTPGYIIPAPLSTSSPMHHKRRLGSRHETLPPLPDLVSPVRHNPKPETHRAIAKDSNIKITKRQQHRNNRHNRFTVYENLDTSSDQEHGFGSPATDYILLTKTAGVIVNRIPFKKSIKPFINMRGLLEYLYSFFLSEMSELPSGNIETISEYRAMKAEACQTLTPDQLTHETCLSELLVSVLVNEPNAVEVCSDFIFKHLRFLSSCPDFYNVPPELFLMLLNNNKGIVLGYHGFPLPYEESVRQVQRAGRKYIQAHKTGSTERDTKLEDMLSFVIDQTSVLKSSHGQPDSGESLFQNSYHEIKYRQSEQFVTDKISPCRFLPNLSLTASASLQASPGEHSDPDMCYEKYCSNAYILRRIYFSYVIQDGVPYISQIRQQYAVQGRKLTYSIGNSTSKSELFLSHRPANSGQNWTDSSHVCTTEASDSSNMVAAVPRTDQLVTAVAAGKSPVSGVEGEGLTPEPAGLKMSAVQLTRGEHVTGVMLQGDSVLHNIMIITNKRRYIRAHGNVEFPGHTDWTLVPPPEEPKYCLQAIVANSRTASSHTYLQSLRVVWSVLSWTNKELN